MSAIKPRNSLFDDFFQDFAPGYFIRPLHGDPLPAPSQIKIDVREDERHYVVHAELPGVSKEAIHVTLEGNMVNLRAEVKQSDSTGADQKTLRSERYFGEVSRSFQLPADVEVNEASARYENGVLELTLPKKASANRIQKLHIA